MEEKKIDKRFYFKAGGILGMFVIGLVVASLLNYPVADTVNHMVVSPRSWKPLGYWADYLPATGCIINISTYPTQTTPGTNYSTNLTSDNCFEWCDNYGTAPGGGGTEMNSTTPHSKVFDFVVKFRTNVTNNYNTSSKKWETRWTKGYIKVTWSSPGAGHPNVYENLTICNITNSASYCYYYAYVNNNGSGYTLSAGETFIVDYVSIYCYQ